MKTITVKIDATDRLLKIKDHINTITTRMDNHAQQLVFVRPEGYEQDRLLLTFEVGGALFETELTDDKYALTPSITQYGGGKLWVTFEQRDGGRTESTNKAIYGVREIPVGTPVPLAPPESTSGPPGNNGKSAFDLAVEGGYTGTEGEFSAALARAAMAVTSESVRKIEKVTQAQYDELAAGWKGNPPQDVAYYIVTD